MRGAKVGRGINIENSTDGKLIDPPLADAEVAAIKRRTPEAFVSARGRHLLAAPRCRHRHHDRTSPSSCRGRGRPHLFAGGERSRRDRRTPPQYPTPLDTLPVPGLTLTHLGELGVARV